jgi:uncharacterized protein YkwD
MGVVRTDRRVRLALLAVLLGSMLIVGFAPAISDADAAERPLASAPRVEPARAEPELAGTLLHLTNDDRAVLGGEALELAEHLSRYATRHSERMARLGYLFHSSDEQLRRALDGETWSTAGENVGVGASLEEVQEAFMDSAPHRHNVLDGSYDRAAIGVVEADGAVWITVIFYGA